MKLRTRKILIALASVLVAGVMVMLGLWQMRSYEESTQDVSAQRAAQPAVSLADSVAADGSISDIFGRQVTATGSYDPNYQVLVGTQEPLRVVTLFTLEDGRRVAVVLGSVAHTTDTWTMPSSHELHGIFLASDRVSELPAAAGADLAALRLQELAQSWPSPLIAGYVTVPEATSRELGLDPAQLMLPKVEGSPTHRGYALQWWVFAVGALAFGGYSIRQLDTAKK